MRTSSFEWTADDGKTIVVHRFTPDDDAPPKALIHIVHGICRVRHAGVRGNAGIDGPCGSG